MLNKVTDRWPDAVQFHSIFVFDSASENTLPIIPHLQRRNKRLLRDTHAPIFAHVGLMLRPAIARRLPLITYPAA